MVEGESGKVGIATGQGSWEPAEDWQARSGHSGSSFNGDEHKGGGGHSAYRRSGSPGAGIIQITSFNVRGLQSKVRDLLDFSFPSLRSRFGGRAGGGCDGVEQDDVLGVLETHRWEGEPSDECQRDGLEFAECGRSDGVEEASSTCSIGRSGGAADGSRHARGGMAAWWRTVDESLAAGSIVVESTSRTMWLQVIPEQKYGAERRSPPLFVAFVYAPQINSGHDVIDEFWSSLSQSTTRWLLKGTVILMGDFNARLGAMVGDSTRNRSGDCLESFCDTHRLSILNITHPPNPLYRHTYLTGTRGQRADGAAHIGCSIVDYVLVPQQAVDNGHVVAFEVVPQFGFVYSDHRAVRLRWRHFGFDGAGRDVSGSSPAACRAATPGVSAVPCLFQRPRDDNWLPFKRCITRHLRTWLEWDVRFTAEHGVGSESPSTRVERLASSFNALVYRAAQESLHSGYLVHENRLITAMSFGGVSIACQVIQNDGMSGGARSATVAQHVGVREVRAKSTKTVVFFFFFFFSP